MGVILREAESAGIDLFRRSFRCHVDDRSLTGKQRDYCAIGGALSVLGCALAVHCTCLDGNFCWVDDEPRSSQNHQPSSRLSTG